MTDKFILWLAVVFVLITAALFLLQTWLFQTLGVHYEVLVAGNVVMALITLISYSLNRKGMTSDNPNVIVRSVYASTLAKLMLCVVAIAIYVIVNRTRVSKPTIFLFMFFYLVYTVFETSHLLRTSKQQKKS
ncbi:hypothetical protein GFS24_19055 [Chitinophaga sp. SYP-B3965]|uniref:hypothetical protein n=1 Tax=Chitinophaga sp. SYP-B3965 TaxID=2663120 RepID=UPI001299B9FD|nr:hypothetical protein [Chitinophaga sp. SYP-B3965]MRG47228.1 hypothetical protein [Chitinophaga sp. SYP-B3965]